MEEGSYRCLAQSNASPHDALKHVPDDIQVAVAEAGALPPLVEMLTSGTPDAKQSAAAALGSLAGNADD